MGLPYAAGQLKSRLLFTGRIRSAPQAGECGSNLGESEGEKNRLTLRDLYAITCYAAKTLFIDGLHEVEAVQKIQGEPVERMFSFFPCHCLLLMIKLITSQKVYS